MYIEKKTKDRGLIGRTPKREPPKPATIPVIHYLKWEHEINYDFVILPVGNFYNQKIINAKKGDNIKFLDGHKAVIYDICAVQIGSSIFRNLCRLRYGREPLMIMNRWKRTAISLGYTPSAIDQKTAVAVWFKKDEDKDLVIFNNDDDNTHNYNTL